MVAIIFTLIIRSSYRPGLPRVRSGKKFWKMKNFPGQGKVRELHFQSGKFRKNEKVREFQNFPKKMLVNRLLEILVSIICKQYQKRIVSEHKLQVRLFLLHYRDSF